MKFSYSFSVPQQPAKPQADEALVEHAYSEFLLNLPAHWRQIPTPTENSFNYYSEVDKASITISADFYGIPDAKAQACAEQCLDSRFQALEKISSTGVVVFNRTIKPYSRGGALEMLFEAELPGNQAYLYLGYVSSRKIFNFALVCEPGRQTAGALFDKIVSNIRVMIP